MGQRFKDVKIATVTFLEPFAERLAYIKSLKQVKSVEPMKSINCMKITFKPKYTFKAYKLNNEGNYNLIVTKQLK